MTPLPGHVGGEGVFTIPYGPVRSGVFESVEYLVETPGEEIPHLRTRVYHKHRGLDRRFGDLAVDDAVLLAERVEGTASVAHAIAFCQALETLGRRRGAAVGAQLVRVVHAELERVAVHLDSIIRHTEGGRPGGRLRPPDPAQGADPAPAGSALRAPLRRGAWSSRVGWPGRRGLGPAQALAEAGQHRAGDRRRRSGAHGHPVVPRPATGHRARSRPTLVTEQGPLGPVGRGSGLVDDVRVQRPYGAYRSPGVRAGRRI